MPNDMVVSTSGTLGRTAIVREAHLPLLLNTSVIRFRPTDGTSYPFMYQFLQSEYFYTELIAHASGSVQLNFGPSHLKRINMIIPSKEMVTEYSKSVAPLYSRIANNLDEIQTLIQIRDTLLPKLMDGEIEVEAHAF
jgi:type I restriction enzyme S subunit